MYIWEPIAFTCLHCPLCAANDEIRQWEIQDDENREMIEHVREMLLELRNLRAIKEG